MAKSYNQKIKLLFLMDLFMERTDMEHTISMKEIISELEKNGISGARKSIYSDIETLKEYGLEIEYRKEHPEGYYLAERKFELIEAAAEYTVQEIMVFFKSIQAMELEVRKPSAPVKYQPEDLSVTIYREWHTVYLSFGSNVRNSRGHINEAYILLKEPYAVRNAVKGEYYTTKPYGPVKQPDFTNGIIELETYMDPEELVTYIHEIEDYMERDRSVKWGPRSIDLDIIFFDDYVYNSKTLTIPHADMENRMFVLEPLAEFCPGYRHPVLGKTVEQLKKELEAKNPDEGSIIRS